MMRRRDRGGTGPALAAVALYAALGVGAGRADPGRLVIAEDEAEALVLRANGAIDRIDLASSEVQSIAVRTGRSPLTAIALPEAGRPVYGIATAEDPRRTDLLALDPSTGEVVRGWQVRGRGRFLHVTRDGAFACIVGLKPGARNDRPGHWMLTVVNLNTGATSKPLALGMKPLAGALRSDDPAGPRLFLAGADRVASFTINPPRPSWFFRSPGTNFGLAISEASGALYLLRDDAVAVIDPDRRMKIEGRVVLTQDDATATIELPARGDAIGISRDADTVAVLLAGGSEIVLIDTSRAAIFDSLDLAAPQDLMAQVIPSTGLPEPRVVLASSTGTGSALLQRGFTPPREPPPGEAVAGSGAPVQEPAQQAESPEDLPQSGPAPVQTEPEKPVPTGTVRGKATSNRPDIPEPEPPSSPPEATAPAPGGTPPAEAAPGKATPGEAARAGAAPDAAMQPAPLSPGHPERSEASGAPKDRPSTEDVEAGETALGQHPPTPLPADQVKSSGTSAGSGPPSPPEGTGSAKKAEEISGEPGRSSAAAPKPGVPSPEAPPARPRRTVPEKIRDLLTRPIIQGPALSGSITGNVSAAREVLVYGPNNILKLYARVPIAGDGTFRLPLPDPGRYRLVVSGGSRTYLFTRPEYRMIVIVRDDRGMQGLDFEVRGTL